MNRQLPGGAETDRQYDAEQNRFQMARATAAAH
jgi:hypothetical protein